MGRLISKHELYKTMHSQLYCAEPPQHMGICTSAMRGGSQQHNFEASKPSRPTLSDPLESQASTFHAAEIYMGSQQYEHQAGNTLCSQIPTYDSQILLSQFSGYNFSTDSAEKAGSNFESRDTLQSLVTYHLCRNKYCSSSDKSIILPSSNTSKLFSPDQKVLFAENAASDGEKLPVPSDATQARFVCHSSSSTPAPRNKKRVRWTQDLHEQFVKCVNGLGGAEKATPKAILKLMDADLLTILHVKSHLQKYRTTQHIPESLQEKSERRTSANDSPGLCTKISKHMKEALRLQLEVERHLHEQLELQQNLQLLIEEENKQLKMMFDQQQKRYKSQSRLGPPNKYPEMTDRANDQL